MRHFRLALLVLLMLVSRAASAADRADELSGLYDALNVLNQQQQSIYQQFQMVQALRRGAIPLYGTTTLLPQFRAAPPNYDDVVAAQNSAVRRDEDLMQQADQLLETYNEIEAQKKPLLQRIYSLTLGQ